MVEDVFAALGPRPRDGPKPVSERHGADLLKPQTTNTGVLYVSDRAHEEGPNPNWRGVSGYKEVTFWIRREWEWCEGHGHAASG